MRLINFPSHSGVSPKVEHLVHPVTYIQTGAVRCMEWSSDGYALAIGWETGWAVWSVGGRCLAWATRVDGEVDPAR